MSGHPHEIGTVTDAAGRVVAVGVIGGKVTLRTRKTRTGGAVELTGDLSEDFMQLMVAALWTAGRQEARMPAGEGAS